MKLIRSLTAAALVLSAGAAFAADSHYSLPLVPTGPDSFATSFRAPVRGLFVDTYSFTPAALDGRVSVSFTALTPSVNFFVADLNGQTFSFFPENGFTSFDFETFVNSGTPLLLTLFGAGLDEQGDFARGRYRLDLAAAVPEPATVLLMLAGLLGVGLVAVQRDRAYTRAA